MRLSDAEKFRKLLGQISYYNAAEGNWSAETRDREATQEHLHEHVRSMLSAGWTMAELQKIVSAGEYLTTFRGWCPPEHWGTGGAE